MVHPPSFYWLLHRITSPDHATTIAEPGRKAWLLYTTDPNQQVYQAKLWLCPLQEPVHVPPTAGGVALVKIILPGFTATPENTTSTLVGSDFT